MTFTTIKTRIETRDKLKNLAVEKNININDLIEELLVVYQKYTKSIPSSQNGILNDKKVYERYTNEEIDKKLFKLKTDLNRLRESSIEEINNNITSILRRNGLK